ncbi:MAG: hypothetical protein ACREJ2_05535 [Planctomycetota bacterium]
MLDSTARLVEAHLIGAHAGQILKGAFPRGRRSEADLKALDRHFIAAAQGDEAAVEALLVSGLKLPPRAPVSIMTRLLTKAAPHARPADVKAVAGLWALALEEHRDGNELQDLFELYVRRGIAVQFGALGLAADEVSLRKLGKAYVAAGGTYPFQTGNYETPGSEAPMSVAYAAAMSLTKIKLWGERHSGLITIDSMAADLELDPQGLLPLVPRMKTLPPLRLCNFGHSFASPVHWSSHGTFACIHAASLKRHVPGLKVKHVNRGGMHYSQALKICMEEVLNFRPDFTVMVLALYSEEDYTALETICTKLQGRALFFDTLAHEAPLVKWARPDRERVQKIARATGATCVSTRKFLDTHPDRKNFLCMDNIHMYPSYHRAMTPVLAKAMLDRLTPASGR